MPSHRYRRAQRLTKPRRRLAAAAGCAAARSGSDLCRRSWRCNWRPSPPSCSDGPRWSAQFPEAASLFRMIGLPVNLRGLVFAGLETRTELRDGVAVLIVEGRIESDSVTAVTVPPLRIMLRDAAGAELYAWTVLPDMATLGPGESLPFHARM